MDRINLVSEQPQLVEVHVVDKPANKGLPPITVLIPVHNGENYLAETLESVLAQSYPAVEVLVINDGSTDATEAIARGFGDRIHLITRENAGVSASRNYGLGMASTDWVALMDHDDLWEKDHLENMAAAITRNPQADVCYSGVRRLQRNSTGEFAPGPPLALPGEEEMPQVLMERCTIVTCSMVAVRAAKALAIGGFDAHYLNAQDWDLWLRMRHNGSRFVYASQPTSLYRIHPASRTHNARRGLRFYSDVVRKDIFPYMSSLERATRGQRILSRLEGEAALLLRAGRDIEGARSLMLRSILRSPFHAFFRYKIAIHMLLIGLKAAPDTQFSGQTK